MPVVRAILSAVVLTLLCVAAAAAVLYFMAPWNYAATEQIVGDHYLAASDYRSALMWYSDAARSNNAMALYRLGFLSEKGLGVGRDDVESYKWYKRAITGSWAPAHRDFRGRVETAMASVEHRMTVAQIAEADSRAEHWQPRAGAPY